MSARNRIGVSYATAGLAAILYAATIAQAGATTFTTKETTLYDPCGEPLVLRGVNAGIAFPYDSTAKQLPEIDKTGANAVRLTFRWLINRSSPTQVETALKAAAANHMVAIPSLWDATGDWSQLPFAINFWAQPDMVAVLRKYEDRVLLNMANEAGAWPVTSSQYRDGYARAIKQLREAGLHMPLVIDAANWGRRVSDVLDNGAYLIGQDPDSNLLFSWHPWDTGQPSSVYQQAFVTAQAKHIPLIIGEFSSTGADGKGAVDYRSLMQLASQYDIGWLWWWWWSGSGLDAHAMTSDGIFGHWANVGEEVATTSPYGLSATSNRTHFLQTGQCAAAPDQPAAPNPPSGLQVVATQGTEVRLSWIDNSDDEKNFDIEVWQESTQSWRLIKVVAADTRSTTVGGDMAYLYSMQPGQDPSLHYTTEYRFRVGAYRSLDAVSYSEPVTVTTGGDPRTCANGIGLKGEYYSAAHQSQDFAAYSGPNMIRIDSRILFNWGADSPNPAYMAADQFQVRWTGYVMPQFDGTYTFFSNSDDFARVWIDGKQIIDNWRGNAIGWALGRIELTAGKKYSIRVEYRDWTGNAKMELHWAHSRLAREVIPRCRLFIQ